MGVSGLFVLKCLWFFLPAALATAAPVFFRGKLGSLDKSVDFGRGFRGKRVFGDHKTWRGLLSGSVVGTTVFLIQKWLFKFSLIQELSLFNYQRFDWSLGFILGFGAISGDLVKSFFKRQRGIKPGKPWFPFDQIDWIIGALIFTSLVYLPPKEVVVVLILFGFILHLLSKFLGYLLKINETRI